MKECEWVNGIGSDAYYEGNGSEPLNKELNGNFFRGEVTWKRSIDTMGRVDVLLVFEDCNGWELEEVHKSK